jgi:hypothetical protein
MADRRAYWAALALVPLAAVLLPATTPGPQEDPGAAASDAARSAGAAGVVNAVKVHWGNHDYWTANVGNGVEATLAVDPVRNIAWTTGGGVLWKTTNAGQTWTSVSLPNVGCLNEGDIAVAPDGDIITNWLDLCAAQAKVWVSTDGGVTFVSKPIVGPAAVADRPWMTIGAFSQPDPSNPFEASPYLAVDWSSGGTWGSADGGETWLRQMPPRDIPVLTGPLAPRPANPYMAYAKSGGQGTPTKFLALPGGELLYVPSRMFTSDFVNWKPGDDTFLGADLVSHFYWDVDEDGTIWTLKNTLSQTGSYLSYKWLDTTWHVSTVKLDLTPAPDYCTGLVTSCGDMQVAFKVRGNVLAVNTRQGTQDLLFRVDNPKSPTPTITKELIGNHQNVRYDFPNVLFDTSGRLITTYDGGRVAYATTV